MTQLKTNSLVVVILVLLSVVLLSGTAAASSHSEYCSEATAGDLAQYCDSREDLSADTDQFLRESDSYIEGTGDLEEAKTRLKQLQEQTAEVNQYKYNATIELFEDSKEGNDPAAYDKAREINSLTALNEENRQSIQEYNSEIAMKYNNAKSGILTPTAIGIVIGTVLGLLGGVSLPGLRYRSIQEKAALTKDIELGRRQVIVPLIVGIFLFGAGIGIWSILIGWETILTVIA